MNHWLVLTWAFIVAFAFVAYVILDGFDLGLGILFPLFEGKDDRDTVMNSVAPVWDGNETWLVMGGASLMAAFPLAFAILLPSIYLPASIMLLALIFRGVAFEFRWQSQSSRLWWDWSFAAGSTVAAFCQGVILGAVLQGVTVDGRHFGGGPFDWCTPFSLLTGLAVVTGYSLLGACWLVMKTSGALQENARNFSRRLGAATLASIALISAATPALEPAYHKRWLSMPNLVLTAPVPVAVIVIALVFFRALKGEDDRAPFRLSLALFGLCFVGLGISIYPYVVPARLTIWQAAAPPGSQLFLLIGTAALLPMILAYTAYAYWVFRGKVEPGQGYH